MTTDHLSYQRATSVSLIGLAVQVVMTLVLLLYGVFGADALAQSGAFVLMLGIPVWLALAIVFQQHKLERLEAQENAAIQADGSATGSVFGDEDRGERVQANKLAALHRVFLPVVSLVLAGAFIVTGVLRFRADVANHIEADPFLTPEQPGWAIAVGVGLLVIGFILGRFVAGMAKQKVWGLLHAGAGAAVAAGFVGATLIVGHAIELTLSSDVVLQYGPAVLDAIMVLLGAEIVLNFVLTLYRPRKAGEYMRPAFDSRVLAFLAAPDRLAESVSDAINYQLGFDVSSTWFYRLVSRSLIGLVVLGGVTLWLLTAVVVVQPDERGLVLRGGELVAEVESGPHVKAPWPFARVDTFPAKAASSFTIGLPEVREDETKPRLWTDANPSRNRFLIVQTSSAGTADDEAGNALLIAEVPIQYAVRSLEEYMNLAQDGPPSDPEELRRGVLRSIASSVLTRFALSNALDEFLGPERRRLESELRVMLQSEFDNRLNAGVEVLFVGLQGVRPPADTAAAYERSAAMGYYRAATIEIARAERIRTLSAATGNVDLAADIIDALDALDEARAAITADAPIEERQRLTELERAVDELLAEAGGESAIDISQARADRWRRHLGERLNAVLSEGRSASYRAAPEVYTLGLYIDRLRDSTSEARVWISPIPVELDLDQTEISTEIGGFGDIGSSASDQGQE